MENYIEVVRKMLELSATCLQAIDHIKTRLNAGQLEQTLPLMSSVVESFYHIEKSLPPLLEQLPDNKIGQLTQQLQQSLQLIVSSYEQGKPGQVQEKLQFSLQPAFHSLHRELEAVMHSYNLS